MPFAVHLPETFAYPQKKESIIKSHLKFSTWSQSGGNNYTDWYRNIVGYRNESKIYPR